MLRLSRILLVIYLVLLSQSVFAQIIYREIIAVGNAGDPAAATVDAIENAIAQVGGMKLSTSTSLTMRQTVEGDKVKVSEDFKQNVEKATRGLIKSYTVLESGVSPGSGRAFVKIKAIIPTYKQSEQLKRLKLAVTPVSTSASLSSSNEAKEFAENVSSSVEATLTQSRKFAMIDRRNTDASGKELNRTKTKFAPLEETLKIGMRVGADYAVMAVLKEFAPKQVQQQRLTGRVQVKSFVPISIDVRVLDIATGQIKFAHSYINPGRLPNGMSLGEYAAEVGVDIGLLINMAIYPIAVVSVSNDIVTFNQGGETVQIGRVYRLVKLGANLQDPYTKESLGQEELEVGRAEVISVTDRTASAKVISGSVLGLGKPGSLLARVLPDSELPTLASGNSSPQANLETQAGPKAKAKDDEDW